jgi:hypothetical protein
MNRLSFIWIVVLLTIVSATAVFGQSQPDVMISFDRKECTISIDTGATASKISFRLSEVQRGDRSIMIGSKHLISGDSLVVGERSINLTTMTVRSVVQREGFYDIELADESVARQSRRGRQAADRYGAFARLKLAAGDFIRGSVLSVGGEIESEAEVNGFVLALFGDIDLGASATCHRDVIAVGGKIKRNAKTRIYGAIQSTEEWKRSDIFRRRRRSYGHEPIEWSKEWSYNRADGLTLGAGVGFRSEDNVVPRFYAQVGYGATSEIWKYRLGFDHKLFDYNQLAFGASVYRQTKSQDDWICGPGENTVYALLRREDFRDYYQGEGADLFIEQRINGRHTLRAEYFVEELDSLPAHPRLWAVFGGKDFRSEFSSVPEPGRGDQLGLYSGDEAAFDISYKYQTVGDPEISSAQGWWLALQYEHSSDAIASDFNYDRYTLELRRYQRINDLLNLNIRGVYGELNGEAPLHRYFYLGGIRTLRGHEIKEYSGTEMALLNVEYVFNPVRTILDFAALLDIGGVGSSERSLSDSRWHGDVGVAVIIGELVRVELTRRFNGESDELQPSVLIGRSF